MNRRIRIRKRIMTDMKKWQKIGNGGNDEREDRKIRIEDMGN